MKVRNLLGLAATTAILAAGLSAAGATAATADTLSPTTASDFDWDGGWGSYYSYKHLAKAKGFIDVNYDDDESNAVHITGKLWDLDHRTYKAGGKCAYVKFRYQSWNDDEDDWYGSSKSYKYCGAPGYKPFSFWRYDVAQVQVKVCQITPNGSYVKNCGGWHEIYNAYDEEDYNYEF